MHRFVMGLSYTDEEHRLTEHILRTGSELLVLSQDYWSWDKEYLAWKTHGTKIKNAVEFWSRTEGLSFELAREKVKTRILDLEQVYIKQSDQFYKDFPKESVALRPWVESIGACNAGLNYWSACAPRYHDWKKSQDMDSLASSVNFLYNSSIGTHPELVSIPLQDLEDSTNSTLVGSFPRQGQEQIALVQRPSALNDRITEAKSSASRACLAPYWRKPDNMALIAPCNYIAKLPSKGMRSLLITAFNDWIGAPMSSATSIKSIIGLLHDASLLIDDVQDNSNFRRGKPAAHTIFGISQALNSGLFMFSQAVQESRKLSNPESTDIVLQNLECLYLGQSWDLYWKHSLSCPSIDEYMNTVDNKTGGMFRMLAQLLKAESLPAMTVSDRERISTVDLDYLTLLIGRFFQIRDDYMNLQSAEYCEQKGFCEDLDEGKYSFPIVHLLGRKPEYRGYITGVFRQLPLGVGQEARLSREMKQSILEILESEGSLAATLQLLKELEGAIEFEITRMETILGKKNATMRLVIATLSVKHLK